MRNANGTSLSELLIVTSVMAFLSSAALGLLCTIYGDSIKLQNKCDSVFDARNALDKITRSVRMGRSVGDVYGAFNVGQGLETGSNTFPTGMIGATANNPVYGAGQAPPNGWPTWADGTRPTTFTLSNTVLVVQTPVFDPNGFPYCIPANTGNPANPNPVDNVETDIYMVVPDPNVPNEWLLQWARIPGMTINGYSGQQFGPTTLCSGIVGPLNNGVPRVFQYLDRTDNTHTPQDSVNPNNVADYSGVIVNLAIHSHRNSAKVQSNTYIKASSLAFKTEVFLRNNAQATTAGVPAPIQ